MLDIRDAELQLEVPLTGMACLSGHLSNLIRSSGSHGGKHREVSVCLLYCKVNCILL